MFSDSASFISSASSAQDWRMRRFWKQLNASTSSPVIADHHAVADAQVKLLQLRDLGRAAIVEQDAKLVAARGRESDPVARSVAPRGRA